MKCKLCDTDIDPERLEVLPETRICVTCAKSDKGLLKELKSKTNILRQEAEKSHSISCQNGFHK